MFQLHPINSTITLSKNEETHIVDNRSVAATRQELVEDITIYTYLRREIICFLHFFILFFIDFLNQSRHPCGQ